MRRKIAAKHLEKGDIVVWGGTIFKLLTQPFYDASRRKWRVKELRDMNSGEVFQNSTGGWNMPIPDDNWQNLFTVLTGADIPKERGG